MRLILVIGALATMASCGPRVSGAVGTACIDAGRSAASPALCSCVQQVADQTLSRREQSRAAEFFADPQMAQDTRQSDNSSNEAFWLRYKAFSEQATRSCRSVT